jgi:molybdopterin converting factor small subunit
MEIHLEFTGILKELFGTGSLHIELPARATFGDLMADIDRRFMDRLPESIWDRDKCEFKPGVLCVGEGRDLASIDTPLKDGETITIMAVMAGG